VAFDELGGQECPPYLFSGTSECTALF